MSALPSKLINLVDIASLAFPIVFRTVTYSVTKKKKTYKVLFRVASFGWTSEVTSIFLKAGLLPGVAPAHTDRPLGSILTGPYADSSEFPFALRNKFNV